VDQDKLEVQTDSFTITNLAFFKAAENIDII